MAKKEGTRGRGKFSWATVITLLALVALVIAVLIHLQEQIEVDRADRSNVPASEWQEKQHRVQQAYLAQVSGSPEFMKRWNTWLSLEDQEAAIHRPKFRDEDYVRLCGRTMTLEVLRNWASLHPSDWRGAVDETEASRIRSVCSYLDCRGYNRTPELDAAIRDSTTLQWLRLSEEYSEQDLEWVTKLVSLQGLIITDVKLQDGDLRSLVALSDLRWLELHGTGCQDLQLPRLKKLTVLHLPSAPDATDLPTAAKFPNLINLRFPVNLGDEGLASVVNQFPDLVALDLMWSKVTLRSTRVLGMLKKLRYLNVNHTRIEGPGGTPRLEALAELQFKLPDCHIRMGER